MLTTKIDTLGEPKLHIQLIGTSSFDRHHMVKNAQIRGDNDYFIILVPRHVLWVMSIVYGNLG
jgi:hypothetical protein